MRQPRAALISSALAFSAATRAVANGRYPAASQIAFDPADPNHLVVSATIGLLESRDRGKSFGWRCESILGSPGNQDVLVVVTANGATIAATPAGLLRSTDGCSFDSAPELIGETVRDVGLNRSSPHQVVAIKLASDGGKFDSQVMRSDDDGQHWTAIGSPLAGDLLPLTIDVAPSDGARVYLSARLGAANDFASVLLRSIDGGQTFESSDIPETSGSRTAYIAAVHPTDADRLYVRVYDTTGTRIWSTSDAGRTFQKIFTGTDQLYGFAISPDGAQIAFGGPSDGISVAASDGTGVTRRSDAAPTCLGWSSDGLYACADPKKAGFLVGRSSDTATTFETLLTFDSLCGQTGCAAETPSGLLCPADWERVAPVVGTTCGVDAGIADSGPDRPTEAGDASDDRSASSPVSALRAAGGGCQLARTSRGNAVWSALVLLAFGFRRRRPVLI
jgi:hypothetical protein